MVAAELGEHLFKAMATEDDLALAPGSQPREIGLFDRRDLTRWV